MKVLHMLKQDACKDPAKVKVKLMGFVEGALAV